MVLLTTNFFPLEFPGTAAEATYLQEQTQHGYDLISVLTTKHAVIYYWKTYNAATTHALANGDCLSPRTDS